ncbi:MAG: hypothetical protein J6R89_04530 [Clostridia bacterium]|nr:hypothetical protein [Clostridia bacterium]
MYRFLGGAIAAKAQEGSPLLVAIEGMSGSGKSSAAAYLASCLDCHVFHMDDFFLPLSAKTPERLAVPGGNVDHERFLEEILLPLSRGEAFSYRPFDCARQTLADPIEVLPGPISIVEGVYSMHPSLRALYGMTVFFSVDREEQSRRILARNGAAMHRRFIEEWIPLENAYFAHAHPMESADLVWKSPAITR